MSDTTLVGIFDDETQARQARQRLQQAGVPEQSIRINAGTPERSATTSSTQPREEEGSISRFFSDLFGTNDAPDARNYDEAVRRGNVVLTVQLADGSRVEAISDLLEDSGAVDVDECVESWKSTGYEPTSARGGASTGRATTDLVSDDVLDMGEARQLSAAGAADADTHTDDLKMVEEELQVGKRKVEQGGVRVRRYITEQPIEEQVSLHSERAQIDRTPVDRPATEADLQAAFQEKTIEIHETTEEPVVSKSARVVEEVRIGKTATDRTETVRDTVRSSKVEVEQLGSQGNRGLYEKGASAANMASRYGGPERRMGDEQSYGGVERRAAA